MSKRDNIHFSVKTALEKDGWTITNDPLQIPTGDTVIKIDMGAEKVLVAQKGAEKIAVEVKTLSTPSIVYACYDAFGKYMLYRDALRDEHIVRELYLAISDVAFNRIKKVDFIYKRINQYEIKVIVVDIDQEIIKQWIK